MDTKEKAEKVRQELAKIVRTYNRYPVLGMFENWPASGLLKLATGAVCGLLFKDVYSILRKSLGLDVCCPNICEKDKEYQKLYSLCSSIVSRIKDEDCIAPNDILYRQTIEYLEQEGHRILIVADVETELYFQAWYENPTAEESEMIFWSSEFPCFMRVVKNLEDVNDVEGRACYDEIMALQQNEETVPLMIMLSVGENYFADEFNEGNG